MHQKIAFVPKMVLTFYFSITVDVNAPFCKGYQSLAATLSYMYNPGRPHPTLYNMY